uniref:Cytoplasmic protein n=1 Tax=Caenorhabditis tropicalis TaxID=1561998 RepID=A0A1I7UEZ7_9PELO
MANRRTNMSIRQLEPYIWLREQLEMLQAVIDFREEDFPGGDELYYMERLSYRIVLMGRQERSIRGQHQIMGWRHILRMVVRRFLRIWRM